MPSKRRQQQQRGKKSGYKRRVKVMPRQNDVLKSKQVCCKHFVPRKPSPYWHKHDVDWVPTLEPGKKSYGREVD